MKRSRLQQLEVRSGIGWSGLGSDLQHDEEGGVGVLGDDEVCVFVFSVALVAIFVFFWNCKSSVSKQCIRCCLVIVVSSQNVQCEDVH